MTVEDLVRNLSEKCDPKAEVQYFIPDGTDRVFLVAAGADGDRFAEQLWKTTLEKKPWSLSFGVWRDTV